jgi:nitroreductase
MTVPKRGSRGEAMDALEAMRRRRSVRAYTGHAIPREDLVAIVDAGRMAASGYNRQPWVFVVVTEPATIERFKVVSSWIDQAAAVIAVVVDDSAPFWHQDASAAVENMLIASTALGYGSCWLEGSTARHEETLKAVLGVPEDRRLITLVAVGVPAAWPENAKKPLDEVLRWERYGAR